MTIRYYTTDLSKAMEYMRIHLRDKYFVSAYKRGIEYVVQVSGLEEVKDEPQTDCDHRCIQTEIGCEKTDCPWK